MKNILILGATSAMARALARRLASPGVKLILAGLEDEELKRLAADLEIRGQGPRPLVAHFDALRPETHAAFWRQILARARTVDEVFLFFGLMHDQAEAQRDFKLVKAMTEVNYLGAASILELIAAYMEKRRQGLIAAVTSPAGDRGRQSNYLYGAAKGALTVYLSGLAHRLAKSGVRVLTIKPGMTDTPMTRNMKKGLLFSKPETIAAGIARARRGKAGTAYIPGYWRWIMLLVKLLPAPLFHRTKL